MCQPQIGEGDATTDVIDAQLSVYKAYTECTLVGFENSIYGMVYTLVFTVWFIQYSFIKTRKIISLVVN